MQIDTLNNSMNFGWNKTTHLEMTMLALKDCNIDNKTKRQIARYTQMPDFAKSELGYHSNTHFYFPNSKKKSFGQNSNQLNAYNQFKEHLVSSIMSKDNTKFLRHAGFAIHYLQDMTVPLHTEKGGLLQKILKFNTHKKFEYKSKYSALANSEMLSKNYKYEKIDFTTLLDLFKDTAKFSQNPNFKITNFNKKKWYSIQQECFNRGVNTTREFFEKLLSVRQNINL